MSFLDKKEQVVEVVLTPYGRDLLRKGALKPAFYAFYDNDIIYDGRYAGLTNYQNDILPRIKEKTPRNRPLFNIAGASERIEKDYDIDAMGYNVTTQTRLDIVNNNHFLANSEIGVQNAPALNVLMLKSQISSSYLAQTSSYGEVKIPQLDIPLKGITVCDTLSDVAYNEFMPIQNSAFGTFGFIDVEEHGEKIIKVYDDKTILKAARNNIVALFTEFNSRELGSNFEMEAFLVTEEKVTLDKAGGDKERIITAKRLYFDDDDMESSFFHYLSINSDSDIHLLEKEDPQVTTGIYDNLPEIEEDFCKD